MPPQTQIRVDNAPQNRLTWARYHNNAWGDGGTTHDHDQARIQKFVAHLDATIDVAIMLEDLDAGLIMFGRAAGLGVVELAYTSMKMGVHNGP